MKRQTHIWYVSAADPGMSKFYVDANPKISISILAAVAKSWIEVPEKAMILR